MLKMLTWVSPISLYKSVLLGIFLWELYMSVHVCQYKGCFADALRVTTTESYLGGRPEVRTMIVRRSGRSILISFKRCACYRNPLCGQEQQTGATLVVRWLVQVRILWVLFLLYYFWCCLLFFSGSRLVSLGVLLCWFCSSTAELYHHMSSFYIYWPISIHFPYMEVSSSWLVPYVSSFLLWTPPTPDWPLRLSVPQLGLPFRVRSLLYKVPLVLYCLSS